MAQYYKINPDTSEKTWVAVGSYTEGAVMSDDDPAVAEHAPRWLRQKAIVSASKKEFDDYTAQQEGSVDPAVTTGQPGGSVNADQSVRDAAREAEGLPPQDSAEKPKK
jgi:hypothetical protein